MNERFGQLVRVRDQVSESTLNEVLSMFSFQLATSFETNNFFYTDLEPTLIKHLLGY